jgi:hypothetical protein
MSAPDPLKEGAGVALSIASELTSVVFAIQNLQLRLVTIPKHQGGKAVEKPSTGPNLKAQQAADKLKFQPALNDRWLAAAGPVETTRAWAAAIPWASQDRTAARAVSRCEARLTVINPRAMAGYQELRLKGVDRADAMVQVAPLFDQPGGGGVRPEGHDVGASIAASASAADEIADAIVADHAQLAAETKADGLTARPAGVLSDGPAEDFSLDALDRTARQPAIGANGNGPERDASTLGGVADISFDDDLTAPITVHDASAAAAAEDVTRRADLGTIPGDAGARTDQSRVFDWEAANGPDLNAPTPPEPAPPTLAGAAPAPSSVDPAVAAAAAAETQPTTDLAGAATPPAPAASNAPTEPRPTVGTPDGDLADAATALTSPGPVPGSDAGPEPRDLDAADLDTAERTPAPAASPTSGLAAVHGTTEEPARDLPQIAQGEGIGATEGVVQATPPPAMAPPQVSEALGAAPAVPGRPEAVPGNAVTDRASETLSNQELGRAAADRAQPDLVPTAADEHSMGIEQAERHAHTADTLHASAVEPARRPPAPEAPEAAASKGLSPAELDSAAPLAEAVNRPKRPKNKPTPPTQGRDRRQGRGLGH